MKTTIVLPARYGLKHTLEYLGENLWQFKSDPKSTGTSRWIGFEGEHQVNPNNLHAFDPEGGPYIAVGSKIENYTVKSIRAGKGCIIELVEDERAKRK